MEIISLLPIVIMIPFLVVEHFLFKVNNLNMFFVTIFRYIQIICFVVYLIVAENIFTYAMVWLCFSFFVVEYYLTIDFLDQYNRSVGVSIVFIPLFIGVLIDSIKQGNMNEQLMPFVFIIIIYYIMMNAISSFFYELIFEHEERVLAQSRLLEQVNETNEELRLNQEKVKKANEQLGIQKIKLEAAYNKINRVNSEMQIQEEIVRYISSSLEIGKLMTLITETIIDEIGVDICAIILHQSNDKENIQCAVRAKSNTSLASHLKYCMEHQQLSPYLRGDSTYIDNNVDEEKYEFINNRQIGSLIIVPLIKENINIGALFVGHMKNEFFVDNIKFFEAIVAQFLIALNNANLYEKMKYMANRDGLTGVYNRRYLTKLYEDELNNSIVNKTSLSVVLFDIDKFKNINDSYGHLFGDTVIQSIASLSENIASANNGEVGRYGGEEFVLLFPNKGIKEVHSIVEKLHNQIRETELVHNMDVVHVTVSMGITSYPETCKNPSELLNRADWAMYYSKQTGRDRITIDKDDIREIVLLKQ